MRAASFLLMAALGAAPICANACYTVYGPAGGVILESQDPPVDMSRPIHETLPSRYPGAHMVFDASDSPAISSASARRRAVDMTTRAPLFTDERTAEAMGVPHRRLAGGIALVQPQDASIAPAVTVVPDVRTASSRSNTSVMGAGPSGRVITELRDPPVTIEQAGDRVTVRPGR